MYGLLLESLACFIKENYGDDKWEEIRRASGVEQVSFSTHQVYPENMIPRLSAKAIEILGVSEKELMEQIGKSFVDFVTQYGYDRVLSVLGRHMRDFLNGLDNLHEYLKFSYPRMRAPSFFCENESSTGLTLHYRSKRKGFVYYTMGQIKQVGKQVYGKDVEIELVKEEMLFDMNVVTFNLKFDNQAFMNEGVAMTARNEQRLSLKASVFKDIFPFCIIFGSDLIIKKIGQSLFHILPELVGQNISQVFDLIRPLIDFKFTSILKRTNNIFELVTNQELGQSKKEAPQLQLDGSEFDGWKIQLKGQMLYMEEWKMIVFLGTPQMADLDAMTKVGLYINDLSMHDFSRDLMMAGTQQSVELKLALDQEQQKSKKLEDSMKKLDDEMQRTDELLYQMIPKSVADRLRKGENPVDTCQVFDCVTILFSDVVNFTEICSRISPMEVVCMLNAMYSIFDRLTELHGVYKVETIGDAYMAVGGAPVKNEFHPARICDMALDMVDAIQDLKDPSTGQYLRIRVGVHSGAAVAGVVGLKMPRYCLFGDSVNTASRMESTSEPLRIHVSHMTRTLLNCDYSFIDRSEISIKGKGTMKTYWLTGKNGQESLHKSGRISAVESINQLMGDGSASVSRGYSPILPEEMMPFKSRTTTPTPRNSPLLTISSHAGQNLNATVSTRADNATSTALNGYLDALPQQQLEVPNSVDQSGRSSPIRFDLQQFCPLGPAVKKDLQLLNDVEHDKLTPGRPQSFAKWKRSSRTKIGILPNISDGDGSDTQVNPSSSNYSACSHADSVELCCPVFNARNHRRSNFELNDHNSVACSIL